MDTFDRFVEIAFPGVLWLVTLPVAAVTTFGLLVDGLLFACWLFS